MTYTFKLSRRLAVSRRVWFLPALVLFAACSGPDATSPDVNASNLPEGIYGWRPRESTPVAVRINPSSVTVETNQLIQFRARGRTRAGDDVVAPPERHEREIVGDDPLHLRVDSPALDDARWSPGALADRLAKEHALDRAADRGDRQGEIFAVAVDDYR